MNEFKKVSFHTLGCKLNFSETSTIGRIFENAGYAKVDFQDTPDVFVINTCSVTHNADKECKQIVNKAMRINPSAFIAIIGCYAQLKPSEIVNITGVDVVLGANEKFEILNYINSSSKNLIPKVFNQEIKNVKEFIPSWSFGDRTRTFLKVQDGCDYFCAFCTIPLARGFSRSQNVSETIKQAKKIADSGIKEVVLTGVNIGDFGKHHNENFLNLINELDTIEGISRFRISSIEPNLLSDDIISFVASSNKFVPHFHIPLQSGNDRILHLMRRRYTKNLFESRVLKINELMPDACIGVDVISGFPTETDNDFEETYDFIKSLPIAYLHAFTYSERDNTTALRLTEKIPQAKRQERTKRLNILSDKLRRAFYASQLGKTKMVLFESDNNDGYIHGYSENYVKVAVPFDEKLIQSIQKTKIGNTYINDSVQSAILNQKIKVYN